MLTIYQSNADSYVRRVSQVWNLLICLVMISVSDIVNSNSENACCLMIKRLEC